MHRFQEKLNKYTGIYRCSDNIDNFKIRVRIKEIPDLTLATDSDLTENWEICEFKWQQKVFNNFERQFYGDEKNCVTDAEKQYHSVLKNSVSSPGDKMLFSYVDSDDFDHEIEDTSIIKNNFNCRKSKEENNLEEVVDSISEFDYETFLQLSLENVGLTEDVSSMYIMADMGEYAQENWIKYEHFLCSLKYDKEKKILRVHPDFSQDTPYHLITEKDGAKNYYYFIEHASQDISEDLSKIEKQIFKKMAGYKNSLKSLAVSADFELPPKNKLRCHIFFEITSGEGFENDEVYVKYFVDLPEKWSCGNPDSLSGLTQTCRASNDEGRVTFGHIFDLVLEYDIRDFSHVGHPDYPYIYFEIVSRESWDRYRCEGLTYHCLPIAKPGSYKYSLPCFRLSDGVRSELRRFFIGDCSNYKDITWIGPPKAIEGNVFNKFGVRSVSTGMLAIKIDVIHQCQAFLSEYNETNALRSKERFIFEKLNSSSLVKSVEQVLEAFRKARNNMIQAREM